MSYNHQSFLKMIGYDDGAEAALEASSKSPDEVVSEEEVLQEEVVAEEFAEEVVEQEELPAELSATEAASDEELPEEEVPAEEEPIFEKTEIEEFLDQVSKTDVEFKEDSLASTEISISSLADDEEVASEIDLDLSQNGTRPTVAFDYSREKTENTVSPAAATELRSATGGTLAFDYDKDRAASRLVVLEGNANAKAFHLANLPLKIGRDQANDIVIDQSNISRFHAEVRESENGIVIVDLGSTNGVKVNGLLGAEHNLKSHDIIQVADVVFEYLAAGDLSNGVPQAVAIANDNLAHSPAIEKKKKKVRYLALGIIGFLIGYYFISHRAQLQRQAEEKATQLISEKVEAEMGDIRRNMEREAKKQITELPADDVKKVFMDRISQSAFADFITPAVKDQINATPSSIIRLFVEDPKLLSTLAVSHGNKEELEIALRVKLNNLVTQKRYKDALNLTEFLITFRPNDASLTSAVEKLKALIDSEDLSAENENGISKDEQKQINSYLEGYEKKVNDLLEKQKINAALKFSRIVRDRIKALMEKEPRFEKAGKAELQKWDQKVKDLEQVQAMIKEEEYEAHANGDKGDRLYETIKAELDLANTNEAKKDIDVFLKEFPEHPKTAEVFALKQEMQKSLDVAFATAKANIEKFIQAESYEGAWQELYRYIDMVPDSSEAKELKDLMEKKTSPKAMQYYNQARVFEFEADDLIAAEQYYKRALEVADPRGELHVKATRRYGEVRRKTIQ